MEDKAKTICENFINSMENLKCNFLEELNDEICYGETYATMDNTANKHYLVRNSVDGIYVRDKDKPNNKWVKLSSLGYDSIVSIVSNINFDWPM